MSLQTSYRFIAPFYDVFIARITAGARQRSLSRLPQQGSVRVLLSGAGTGLDFPLLPTGHVYTALDLTGAMLARSRNRAQQLKMSWVQGDSMRLPFADDSFDCVVLHLIVAVVPLPERCLVEAARVVAFWFLTNFYIAANAAWLRRSLSFFTPQLATRMDVVFEDVLVHTPNLRVISDEPALAAGWFRLIELLKKV